MKQKTQTTSLVSAISSNRRRELRQRLGRFESLEQRTLMAVSIGDYVWHDSNFDGIQNEGASDGVNGVVVSLFTASGTQVGSSTQTADDPFGNPGYYEFNDVAGGDYYVKFTAPAGKAFTKALEGGNVNVDSNVDRDGKSDNFTLLAGGTNLSIDAGLVASASVGTFVWWDENADGLQVDLEGGIGGATVRLLQNGVEVAEQTTDEFGQYFFENLVPGTYAIQFVRPAGFEIASPPDVPSNVPGRDDKDDSDGLGDLLITAEFTLSPGETNRDVDQGFYKSARVGNYVWRDVNNNGIQDENANFGINGVTVTLFTAAGSQVGNPTITTDDDSGNPGYYLFDKLGSGQYFVRFTAPAGQVFTTAGVGSAATDSNADPSGQTGVFTLSQGALNLSIDAGLRSIDLSLSAFVSDTTPPLNSNVTYTVAVSNPSGFSAATGVTVKDVLPLGLSYLSDIAGGIYNSISRTWNVGTIAPGATALLEVVARVTSGGTKTNFVQIKTVDQPDFDSTPDNAPGVREDDDAEVSLTPSASLGNYVWRDVNNDGIQNEDASFGINGVTVTLFTNTGTQVGSPTVTSNDEGGNPGYYLFSDIDPGNYYVVVTAPAGQVFTTQSVGTSATDSNVDSTGKSNLFALQSGINNLSVDAGLRPIDLSLTSFVTDTTPVINATVTYSVTVSNPSGFSAATGVTVKDVLPPGLTYVSDNAGGNYNSTTRTWTVGTVAPGNFVILQVVATVTSAGTKSTVVQVQSANQPDFDSTPGNAPAVQEDDNFEVSLTSSAAIGNYVWRDVNNDGVQNEDAILGINGVTVTLFTGTGTQVGSPTVTSNDDNGNPGYYYFGDIDPGDYYVVVTAPAGQVFTTQSAGVPSTDSDVDGTGRSSVFGLQSGINNLSIDAGFRPIDLSLTSLVTDTTPAINATVTYSVTVNNASGFSAATGVTVKDVLPPGLTYVSDNAGGSYNSATRTWNAGMVAPGDSVLLQVLATVTSAGTKTNVVQIQTADQPDADSTPGNAPAVREDDDFEVSLTPSATIGNYVWRDVNNDGVQNEEPVFGINGVAVTLFTDSGTQVGSPTVTSNDVGGNPGYYFFSDIDPGSYYVVVTAPAGQVFTTQSAGTSVTDSDVDSTGRSIVFSLQTGMTNLSIDAGLRPVDLSLSSFVTDTTPAINATVTYSVTVNNESGLSAATGVTVKDVLPPGLTYVSDNSGGNYNSTTRTWTVGTVAPGNSVILQVVATVTSAGTKTNVVQVQIVDQPDFDSVPGNAPTVQEDDDASVTTTPSANVGNYAWRDENGDGIQNEPASLGINGVTVTLFTSSGMQVGSAVTSNDASGNPGFYFFNDINPGNYYITVSAVADLTFTTQFAAGATPSTDSNVDPNGKSNTFAVSSGVDNFSIDAGFKKGESCVMLDFIGNSSTSGTLGNIRNFSSGPFSVNASAFSRDKTTGTWANAYLGIYGGGLGVTDSSEGNGSYNTHTVDNIGGRHNYILFEFNQTVVIDSAFLDSVTDDSDVTVWIGTVPNAFNSHQSLSDALLAGLYTESNLTTLTTARLADLNAGGILGNFVVIAADVNDPSPEDQFKLKQLSVCTPGTQLPARIGNFVWHDLNGNGIQESGELGIEGANVTLTGGGADGIINGVGDTVVTTSTNSTGAYSFTNLTPGTQYRVTFVVPPEFTAASPRKQGNSNSLDSDGLVSDVIILGSGQVNSTIDAGFYKDVSIGDFVWNDVDNDGIQDITEVGIDGVLISLTGTSGSGTAVTLSTATASDGSFTFRLQPGTYQVSVATSNFGAGGALFGYSASPTLVGTDRALDSNAAPSATSPATLVSGSTDSTVDFGYSLDTTKVCVNLYLEGNDPISGTAGNMRTFSSGSISTKASGFSRDSAGNWSTAYLGRYGGGLGVTDPSEGNGSGDSHTTDNIGRDNYVLFEFSQGVTVDSAFLGYVVGDSDLKVWVGNAPNAFNSHYTLSDQFLAGLGFSEVNYGSSSTRTADFNAGNLTGNILVIAANTGESSPNDRFKLAELKLCATVPTPLSGTKFFTVNENPDGSERTFKYRSTGNYIENFTIAPKKPRGITSNVSGSNVWIANSDGKIYNYTSDGAFVSHWNSKVGNLQGITTNGTHIWTVSDDKNRVYHYPNGTTYTDDSSVHPASSFALHTYNKNPTDLTTDGTFIWVVNEGDIDGGVGDMVFKYSLSGTYLGRWQLDAANSRPTGITVDPAGGNKIWIVDNSADRIFEYSGATGAISGGLFASTSYALSKSNGNAQGVADPVGPSDDAIARESSLAVNEQYINPAVNPHFNTFNATDVNSDGVTSPLDALLVINRLNAMRRGQTVRTFSWIYDDVSDDGTLSPLDALIVINELNAGRLATPPLASGAGNEGSDSLSSNNDVPELAGEGEGFSSTDAFFADLSDQFDSYAGESEEERFARASQSLRLQTQSPRSVKRNFPTS